MPGLLGEDPNDIAKIWTKLVSARRWVAAVFHSGHRRVDIALWTSSQRRCRCKLLRHSDSCAPITPLAASCTPHRGGAENASPPWPAASAASKSKSASRIGAPTSPSREGPRPPRRRRAADGDANQQWDRRPMRMSHPRAVHLVWIEEPLTPTTPRPRAPGPSLTLIAPAGSAARRAAVDGCGEHREGHRQIAHGGAHAARRAVFEVGRRLRSLVVSALGRAGVATAL